MGNKVYVCEIFGSTSINTEKFSVYTIDELKDKDVSFGSNIRNMEPAGVELVKCVILGVL